jgi:hypothetical protein
MKDDSFRFITITMFVLLSVLAAIQQYQIGKLTRDLGLAMEGLNIIIESVLPAENRER